MMNLLLDFFLNFPDAWRFQLHFPWIYTKQAVDWVVAPVPGFNRGILAVTGIPYQPGTPSVGNRILFRVPGGDSPNLP